MESVKTLPRTAVECAAKTAKLERGRVQDLRELALLSARRSGIVLHGSKVDLVAHDKRRDLRQRRYDLAVADIASAEEEHDGAVRREAGETGDALTPRP